MSLFEDKQRIRQGPKKQTFTADDWQIELTLVGGFKKDVVPERSIGSAMGDIRSLLRNPLNAVRHMYCERSGRRILAPGALGALLGFVYERRARRDKIMPAKETACPMKI